MTSSMSTQILFTLVPDYSNDRVNQGDRMPLFSERSDDRRCDALPRYCPALGSVSRGIVIEQPSAALAGHHGFIVAAVAEVVPALRPNHHLAGHALLIERLGHCRSLRLRDAVVV